MTKIDELHDPTSCLNKAADDELLFVLRAKDPSAPAAVRAWASDRVRRGINQRTDGKILEALEWVARVTWDHMSDTVTARTSPPTVDELRLSVSMIRTYADDCFPRNDKGQIHFARAMMDAFADTVEQHLDIMVGIAATKTLEGE